MDENYLKVDELKAGYLYRIRARNARIGIWMPDKGEFLISRNKFGNNYLFEEIHWDLSDHFGTVRPKYEIEKAPFNEEDLILGTIERNGKEYWGYPRYEEVLAYLNKKSKELDDGD